MITTILSFLLFLVFAILSLFHWYWLFGGQWGLDSVIPTKEDLSNLPAIPKFATLVVAVGLGIFGISYLLKTGLINVQIPNWVHVYVHWFIPSIFILRAIGEFNYVGLFKKVRNTKFAKADTRIFVPLCLFIGIIGTLIQLLK